MATPLDIAQILSVIVAAYPNFTANKSKDEIDKMTEVYYQILNDIPSDLLKAAALQCVSESGRKFAPSVGEIRGAVGEIRGRTMDKPSSYQAWQEVLKAFNDVGYYKVPEWSHPLIKQTVDVLGWKNLCVSENQIADRARFIQAFDQLEKRFDNDALELPEVKAYIEANKETPPQLEAMNNLAKRLEDK